MASGKLNESFRILRGELEERVKMELNGRYNDYLNIIPLRRIKHIDYISLMTEDFIKGIIRAIPLRGDRNVFPYLHSDISLFSREPKGLMLSQKFVMEDKLLGLMNSFCNQELFKRFVIKGISDMPPTKVYGRDEFGEKVISIYLPPIIEQRGEGEVLLDGTHRSYICRSVGSGVYALHINNVSALYPTTPVTWNECKVCKVKPSIEERYNGLNKELFRDLNYVGIDG